MDNKTQATLNSITPNYSTGHMQSVPLENDADLPPSYEIATTSSSHSPPRPSTASSSSASSHRPMLSPIPTPSQPTSNEQYTPPKPMKVYYEMSPETRTSLENAPGCCFSTTGGCFFSDMGGCFFSDSAGCCFSSNAGCCFSDNAGCFFSNHAGCCFSDHEGCFCSDNKGCCFTDGEARPKDRGRRR